MSEKIQKNELDMQPELSARRRAKMTLEQKKLIVQKKLDEQWEYDHELISGVFRNIEHPNGIFDFRFKKYAGDEYKRYQLYNNQKYTLPRMIVEHLNNNVHYVEYKQLKGDPAVFAAANDGSVKTEDRMTAKIPVPRCEFIPLSLTGDKRMMPHALVQVGY